MEIMQASYDCLSCLKALQAMHPNAFIASRLVVCQSCGNKRCPRATDHNLECTGSNEPGQVGSAYQAAPPEKHQGEKP